MKFTKQAALAAGISLLLVFVLFHIVSGENGSGGALTSIVSEVDQGSEGRGRGAENSVPVEVKGEKGAEIERLKARAFVDAQSADNLGSILVLCNHLNSDYGAQSERLNDARWGKVRQVCTNVDVRQLMIESSGWARPEGVEWDALYRAIEMEIVTPQDLNAQEALLSDLIRTSDKAEVVQMASATFFKKDRLMAWSHEVPLSLVTGDGEAQRDDLGRILACRLGRDCSPNSYDVLAQCALTARCYPGGSMEKIVSLRQSPQDLAMIYDLVDKVIAMRAPVEGR